MPVQINLPSPSPDVLLSSSLLNLTATIKDLVCILFLNSGWNITLHSWDEHRYTDWLGINQSHTSFHVCLDRSFWEIERVSVPPWVPSRRSTSHFPEYCLLRQLRHRGTAADQVVVRGLFGDATKTGKDSDSMSNTLRNAQKWPIIYIPGVWFGKPIQISWSYT